ncbi:MAG TPA: hypothetical protein VGN17_02610 [Bryobacteraceae bacterium]|jgi:hypothetical protein
MNRIIVGFVASGLVLASASAAFAGGRVAQRQERQQQRVGNGVSNGSLTAHETGRIEHQETRLNHEVRADRRANGGTLTNHEKAQINRQQNGLSREIDRDKHNGRIQ